MKECTLDDIRGRPVIDKSGTTLGQVEDVAIDPATWTVRGIVVGLRNEIADELRVDRTAFGKARLNVSPGRVQALGDNLVLNVDTTGIAGFLREGEPGLGGPRA